MARTRKAYTPKEKMDINGMLQMVAKSTDNGFPVPYTILKDLSNNRTITGMVNDGLIERDHSAWMNSDVYWITNAGREYTEN